MARLTLSDLTDLEKRVLENAVAGEPTDCRVGDPDKDDPAKGADWGEDRTVLGEALSAILLGHFGGVPLDPFGLQLHGARVSGELHLRGAHIPVVVGLGWCSFEAAPVFMQASTRGLALEGSHLPGFLGDGLVVEGDLLLRKGFRASGEVRMLGAKIAGDLTCNGGRFEPRDGDALSADRAKIAGGVFLNDGFHATGDVRVPRAEIRGDLDCDGARLEPREGDALNASGANIAGSVFLTDGFHATGEVCVMEAQIGGSLSCNGGHFEPRDGDALSADRAKIAGGVFLTGGFHATGQVRLLGAEIAGILACQDGRFEPRKGYALAADRAKIAGTVFLTDGFRVTATVRMLGAEIGGDLNCRNGRFEPPDGDAIHLSGAVIGDRLILPLASAPSGGIELSHAKVETLWDDEAGWPAPDKLHLDGFAYTRLHRNSPLDPDARLRWLRLQPQRAGEFFPQPYERLIKVYREMGHDAYAKSVAIRKQDDWRRFANASWRAKAWHWFLGKTLGYGYQPIRAFVAIGIALLLGWEAYWLADMSDVMAPTKATLFAVPGADHSGEAWPPASYPAYNWFWYAVDTFFPVVDLHQETYWQPDVSHPLGGRFRWFGWIYMGFGWVLSTIAVVGLTGVVKKD